MKKTKLLAGWMAAFLLLAVGCGAGSSAGGGNMETGASSAASADSAYLEENGYDLAMPEPGASSELEQGNQSVYQNSDAKLIRRGELSIQTTEFDAAVQALDKLVTDNGGYYENAVVYGGSYRNVNANRSGEYVVRIPSEKFDVFRSGADGLGYVTHNSTSSENIGEQYYDTESRLKTQKTKQERLLTLLEKAETMEDIIQLENALSDVEYQIEQLSTTLNRYDALINYSTFTIYLEEVTKVDEHVGETASLGKKISAGFSASGEGLVKGAQNLLVWLSYHIFGTVILLAIVGVGVVTVVRKTKKDGKKKTGGTKDE